MHETISDKIFYNQILL